MQRTEQFRLSSIVWHEVPIEKSMLNINDLEDLLNQNLSIKNYTQDFDYVDFMFIMDLPKSIHDEFRGVSKKKRYIYLQLKLDYFEVMSATPEEVKQLMAALYLNSILSYPKMRLKSFDYQRFYSDVKALFEKHGLLKETGELAVA